MNIYSTRNCAIFKQSFTPFFKKYNGNQTAIYDANKNFVTKM